VDTSKLVKVEMIKFETILKNTLKNLQDKENEVLHLKSEIE
jgi:hypothetical protein